MKFFENYPVAPLEYLPLVELNRSVYYLSKSVELLDSYSTGYFDLKSPLLAVELVREKCKFDL